MDLAPLIPLVMGIVWSFDPFLAQFGVDPAVLRGARPYLHTLNWSTPPLILYFCFRRYLQARRVVRPMMWALVTANPVNLAGNWVLVFGHMGAPRLGAVGSAWSTLFSRLYMAAALAMVLWRREGAVLRVAKPRPDFARIRKLLRIGLPAAGTNGGGNWRLRSGHGAGGTTERDVAGGTPARLEYGLHDVHASARNQLGGGGTGGSWARTRRPARRGSLGMDGAGAGRRSDVGGGGSSLAAPRWIARLFTPQAEVIAHAATMLRIAAFFQLFDGLQVVTTGALRGAGDTRTPMLLHFAGYWLIGLPLGIWLCFARCGARRAVDRSLGRSDSYRIALTLCGGIRSAIRNAKM